MRRGCSHWRPAWSSVAARRRAHCPSSNSSWLHTAAPEAACSDARAAPQPPLRPAASGQRRAEARRTVAVDDAQRPAQLAAKRLLLVRLDEGVGAHAADVGHQGEVAGEERTRQVGVDEARHGGVAARQRPQEEHLAREVAAGGELERHFVAGQLDRQQQAGGRFNEQINRERVQVELAGDQGHVLAQARQHAAPRLGVTRVVGGDVGAAEVGERHQG